MTAIRAVTPISVRYPEPNDSGAIRHLTLCRIEADDGTVGWGEAVTSWPDACRATEAMIDGIADGARRRPRPARQRRDLAELPAPGMVVRQPRRHLVLRALRDRHRAVGSQGQAPGRARRPAPRRSAPCAASRRSQARIRRLRASRRRPTGTRATSPSSASRAASSASGSGATPDSGSEIERDVELIRLLRERIGPDPMLMWDRGVNTLTWDASFAIRLTNALEEHGLTWIEEPFEPDDIESFRRLKSRCSTLVASGEREWNVEGYRSFIATGVADVIGFDPGRAEGITGGRRVIELVEEAGVWFNAHAWSSAIVSAASLALSLTTPAGARLRAEGRGEPDAARARRDARSERGDGFVEPLGGPGAGIESARASSRRTASSLRSSMRSGNVSGNGCCRSCGDVDSLGHARLQCAWNRYHRRFGEPRGGTRPRLHSFVSTARSSLTIAAIETIAIRVPLTRTYHGSTYKMTHRSTIVTRIRTEEGIVGEAYCGDEDAGLHEIDAIIRTRDRAAPDRRGRLPRRALLGARAAGDVRHPARPPARPRRDRLRGRRDLGRDRQGARPAAPPALGRLPRHPARDHDRRLLRHAGHRRRGLGASRAGPRRA